MESGLGLFDGELLAVEELHHQLFARARDRFAERVLVVVGDSRGVARESALAAVALVVEGVELLLDQVDQLEFPAVLVRDHDGADGRAELLLELGEHALEGGFVIVVLVDEESDRRARLFRVLPCELRADFDAGFRVEDDQCGIGGANGGFHLALEVEGAGSVEKVDLDLVPRERGDGKTDGEAALRLFCVVVADGVALRDLAEAVGRFGGVQHCLGERRFAAPAVTKQAYVADGIGVEICHCDILLENNI